MNLARIHHIRTYLLAKAKDLPPPSQYLRVAKPYVETTVRRAKAWLRPTEEGAIRPEGGPDALAALKEYLRRPLIAIAMFSLVINLLMLTVPLYMMQVYDRVLSSFSVETLVMLTGIALGLLLLQTFVENVRSRLLTRAVLKAEQCLGGVLLRATMEDHRAGRPDAGQAMRDLYMLRGFATGPALSIMFDAPLVPIYVILIFMIHTTLGVTAIWGAAAILMLAFFNQRMTEKPLHQANHAMNRLLAASELQARNADVVTAMGLAPTLLDRFGKRHDAALKAQWIANDDGGYFQTGTRFLRLALQVGALGLGALLVLKGEMTGGMMLAVSIILSRALAPIEAAVSSWRALVAAGEGIGRIKDALTRLGEDSASMVLPAPKGRLSFENAVLIAGPERHAIIKGVSFTLEPGTSLGIIGPVASGKSTLGRLALGVMGATSGKVRLDGADLALWPRDALGPHIGYLPQEVELFSGTVAENIARMGTPNSEAVIRAAEWAGVQDMILRLPLGFDTPIMAGGLMLTPGQRQRIALARAFYGDPKLVVLDEPNANLDGDGEEALARTLTRAKAARVTVIVIAHRPGVLAQVERILLLQAGAAVAFGPRDEVLGRLTQRAQGVSIAPFLNVVPRPGVTL
jgi:PrtD family type I secretion system ABC transporter